MINSDFKIDKNIKQSNVCKFLDTKEIGCIKTYSFNPSKYPGINIKFTNPYSEKLITCAMFRPGSVIITGGNDINSYKYILNQIFNLLQNNNDFLY
jgi:TATA-box binding protein (TBP) (component of TFIID and TFIIIB)